MRNVHKPGAVVLGVILLFLAVGVAMAQSKTVEIRTGTVLAVQGNTLVVRGPEGVKAFTVADDFRFDMDGRSLSVHELEPGMPIAAMITVTETPVTFTETKVVKGEVLHTSGSSVVVRTEAGELKRFTAKQLDEAGVVVRNSAGNLMSPLNLRKGQVLTATIHTELPPQTITEAELAVFVQQAPPPPTPRRAAPPPPPPPAPKPAVLPKTGSILPALGLSGLILLALGVGLTVARRFRILG